MNDLERRGLRVGQDKGKRKEDEKDGRKKERMNWTKDMQTL